MSVQVRIATSADLAALLPLMCAHADHERTHFTATPAALSAALTGSPPRVYGWIAEAAREAVGYASATIDHSTWLGTDYLHLDCLFVRTDHRSRGIGSTLLAAVRAYAARLGLRQIQWQTPAWNDDACRFYLREGAEAVPKLRFSLAVEQPSESKN